MVALLNKGYDRVALDERTIVYSKGYSRFSSNVYFLDSGKSGLS